MSDFAGIVTSGTTLGFSTTETGTYTLINGVVSIPDIANKKQGIDVTTLEDDIQKEINGLAEKTELELELIYKGSNLAAVQALQDVERFYKITVPGGITVTFKAVASVGLGQLGVNEAVKIKFVLKVLTLPTITSTTTP